MSDLKPKIWLAYDQDALDAQYNQSVLVPDFERYIAEDIAESRRVRATLECRLDVAYGTDPAERLDIFPARAPEAPLVVYLCGGAWTRADRNNDCYMAEGFVAAGAAFVVVSYALCPKVSLDELVGQARAAVAWSYRNARTFNADPNRLYIGGHSSGGHVGGMMVVNDWVATHSLPRNLIKGAMLCSGIYDLKPVRLSARNTYLKLDEESARRNSPILAIHEDGCPLIVGYGEYEHKEFRRQSQAFAEAWRSRGLPVQEFDVAGQNHFALRRKLSEAGSPLFSAMKALMFPALRP